MDGGRRIGLIAIIGGKQDTGCSKRNKGLARLDDAKADPRGGIVAAPACHDNAFR